MLIGLGGILLTLLLLSLILAEVWHAVLGIPRNLTYEKASTLFFQSTLLIVLLYIAFVSSLALDGWVLLSDGVVACATAGGK